MKRKRSTQQKSKPAQKTKPAWAPQDVDPVMGAFFEELRNRRLAAGLSQDQMAERAELTPNYIGTVENGYRDPSLSTLEALAKGLGVPLGTLFGPVPTLSSTAREMAELFADAPVDIQTSILRMLQAIMRRERLQAQRSKTSG